jgi:hypothetical protein
VIHYTVLPEELIFNDSQFQPSFEEVMVEGVNMLIQIDDHREGTIVRLLSPDPMTYLDERFQPGRRVKLFPKI